MLDAQNITVRYGGATIVKDISLSVQAGQRLMIVGPNGAGKSTLVKAITQGTGFEGKVTFEGADVSRLKPAKLARLFGVLDQTHHVGYAFSVEEVVRLGRYSYATSMLGGRHEDDDEKVEDALRATGMLDYRARSLTSLSGGEVQRTFLAQLLAQDPKLLILDEPANHLDLFYQKQLFELIGEWIAGRDRAVVSVVHDLNLARAYGTHALLLKEGTQVAQGTVDEVLTRENLLDVYSIDVYGWMRGMLAQWGA